MRLVLRRVACGRLLVMALCGMAVTLVPAAGWSESPPPAPPAKQSAPTAPPAKDSAPPAPAKQGTPTLPPSAATAGPTTDLTREAEPAIERGLRWLKDSQQTDGSWGDHFQVASTALALIAHMARGYTPGVDPYGKVIDKGVEYLLNESKSSPSGYMGTSMYEHGLATLALSELWGQTDRDDDIKTALKAAVEVILRSQNRSGGWRYNPRPTDADISVTVMQTVALASARQAGILIPDRTIDAAVRYIKAVRDPATGGFTYQGGGAPGFARTAAGVFALITCGEGKSEEAQGGLEYLLAAPERTFRDTEWYWYAHYYAMLVMHRAGDEQFKKWYTQVRGAVLQKQAKDGHWDGEGGAAYGTAMAIIVLSIPYDFVPAYQR